MNLIISIVFVICTFQNFLSSKINVEAKYDLEDLKNDVRVINETVGNYKESVFLLLVENYERTEEKIFTSLKNTTRSKLTELQIEYGINKIEDVQEPAKSCFANSSAIWRDSFLKIMKNLRECATNVEIINYMIPIKSYNEFLISTINKLDLEVEAEIYGSYEKKNYSAILTKEDYVQLKSSELNILVNGLRGISNTLMKLLTRARENVLNQTNDCAYTTKQKLNEEWLNSLQKIKYCFSLTQNENNSSN